MVKTPCFHCRGHGFDPWLGTNIPHATQHSQKKEKKNQVMEKYNFMHKNISIYTLQSIGGTSTSVHHGINGMELALLTLTTRKLERKNMRQLFLDIGQEAAQDCDS